MYVFIYPIYKLFQYIHSITNCINRKSVIGNSHLKYSINIYMVNIFLANHKMRFVVCFLRLI